MAAEFEDIVVEQSLRDAVSSGDTFAFAKIVSDTKYDLSIGDSVHSSLLHTAVQYGQIEMMKMLVDYGLDINTKSSELTLCNTPLHDAVNKGDLKMVTAITAELEGDINCQNSLGLTPLAIAALKGHTQIATYLLTQNADASIEDHQGKTAYTHAKENGHLELLKHLPEKKWSLDNDPKWKALVEAKLKQNEEAETKKTSKGKKKGNKKK
eukprot:CAMPEP_0197024680 /NCGR_PEP_ID=MMETSP1384-20130603/5187_1 /TAXON_ID=29189 /ORGANISM="Ammonia sp." /LENGTH=209 /DNA_ID=CAMNT_0042453101 /DNA_START=8 /DNA_END=637 /DNA_ORIENTATION=+